MRFDQAARPFVEVRCPSPSYVASWRTSFGQAINYCLQQHAVMVISIQTIDTIRISYLTHLYCVAVCLAHSIVGSIGV